MTVAPFRGAVEEAFARAARSAGVVRRAVRAAGHALEIRFAGDAMIPALFGSLRHLESGPDAAPSLTIHTWDEASTGAPPPAVPWGAGRSGARAEDRLLRRDGPLRLFAEPGMLSGVDVEDGCGVCVYASAGAVPPWDVAAPFRFVLSSWFAARGAQIVHAAAVATRRGAALLTAPGGSGKSATALACLESGLRFLGDDFVLVGAPPDPLVFGLYSVAKLDPAFLSARLPGLEGSVLGHDPRGGGKTLVDLASSRRSLLAREAPLAAIVVPRVADALRLRPIAPMEALRALAPTTLLCLPGAGQEALGRMAALVRSVPCLALDLGGNAAEIARLLSDVIDTAPAHAH